MISVSICMYVRILQTLLYISALINRPSLLACGVCKFEAAINFTVVATKSECGVLTATELTGCKVSDETVSLKDMDKN